MLYVGNFLSASLGTKPYCEILTDRLEEAGWSISRSSSRPNRILRLRDMLLSVARFDANCGLVLVDVFSTSAFFWAELVSFVAARKRLKTVFILRGGNLPLLAKEHPRRLRSFWGEDLRLYQTHSFFRKTLHTSVGTFSTYRMASKYLAMNSGKGMTLHLAWCGSERCIRSIAQTWLLRPCR